MKGRGLFVMVFSIVLGSEAGAKDCSIPQFNFNMTSQGPWPAFMTVRSGKSCGSRNWTFGSTVPKRLLLAGNPQHGKVVLSEPGTYRYFPSTGYLGDDTFTLRLCGTANGGFEGCADLRFSVKVVSNL